VPFVHHTELQNYLIAFRIIIIIIMIVIIIIIIIGVIIMNLLLDVIFHFC